MKRSKTAPKVFVLDVDGVLTTGHFLYSEAGKQFKVFGPDDNDALSLLAPHLEICFITGDKKGFAISRRRIVDDMNYPLHLVGTIHRLEWIKERWSLDSVIYMGDGIFDHYVMKHVRYALAPGGADLNAQKSADYVCKRSGGNRAVAEACLHLLGKFFEPYDPSKLPKKLKQVSDDWIVQ